jgi:hypothetical protein
MLKIAVIVLAVLLSVCVYFPGAGILSAEEEAEASEEMLQDEEQMDAEDLRQMLYEEQEMQDNPDNEAQVPEEEQELPDERYQDDRG